MRQILEERFLPFVNKPGRYAGGEIGRVIKDHSGRTTYLHAYPDKYEVGQSHVGLQSLYHVVNKDERFVMERVFALDIDAEARLRDLQLPLFSLESRHPAHEFDALGFSLVDEANYTNLLVMLDLAGIPLRAKDRDDPQPIILAGGPAVFNPEPLAPFVDCFFIGDAEEGLPEILAVLHEQKAASREDKLAAICQQVSSTYVPRFYNDTQEPTVDFAPKEIPARIVAPLKADYFPEQPLVPIVEIAHNHLGVEIMRGCPQGCRYCMAGPIYKPVRKRPPQEITRQIETQLRNSGYGEVTLLSLSSSDYPDIEELATTLAGRFEGKRISLSLPSLRPGTISPGLLAAMNRVRVGSLTIAPEAGTERLRLFLRKDFPDAAIYDTARLAFEKGISTLKLYFMIGLPTETEEDLLGIVEMAREIQRISKDYPNKQTINVTLSPFVPKPHTPFQWDEALPEPAMFERLQFVKRKCRVPHTNVRFNDTRLAQLVCAVGRGGREMADVIERAFQLGCRFDAWSEHFDWEKWQQAFADTGVDPESTRRALSFDKPLPWRHIRKGPSFDHLKQERHRTSLTMKDYTPKAGTEPAESTRTEPSISFGRGKKKVASRASVTPTRSRIRLRWGRGPRFRYISHLDNLRLMERLIRQADLPVAWSQGFNPSMKLSFGPPLPVGFTSECEFVDIVLDQPFMNYMLEQLQRFVPEGMTIFEAKSVLTKSASLTALLNRITYTAPVASWNSIAALEAGLGALLEKDSIEIERPGKQQTRIIDIRPAMFDLSIQDEHLVMTLGIGDGGYAKPTEVLALLADDMTIPALAVPCHRREMFRVTEAGEEIKAMDL